MRVISLGWGVQSFALAAMSALGELPPVDAAIHADTTHERRETYEFAATWTPWLEARGVHVGSRAVVSRERKQVQHLGDYIASFALDDRMGLISLVYALREMANRDVPPTPGKPDLYFVAAHGEEVGMLGAMRAAQTIQPDLCVALDTSPVAHGLPVVLDARPVVWYRERAYHTKTECDKLLRLASQLGFGAQPCLYVAAASDAGRVREAGLAGKTVCFGYPRENSHGYEIAHASSLVNVTRLLVAYLRSYESG